MKRFYNWIKPILPVLAVVVLAIAVRAIIDFSTPLIPKTNGAYYLVQARSVLENGRQAFADFPLLFWIDAGVARLIMLFGAGIDSSINLATKLVDVVFPSLIAIPVYFITLRFYRGKERPILPALTVALFSVLFFSVILMTADFQKNSVGLMFFMFFVYFFLLSQSEKKWKWTIAGFVFFILACSTHIMTLILSVGFAVLSLGVMTFINITKPEKRKKAIIFGLISIFILAVSIGIMYFLISQVKYNLANLISYPLKLFERPFILNMTGGMGGGNNPDMISLVLGNILAIWATIILIIKWRTTDNKLKSVIIPMIFLAFFLASPFIGQEYVNRFLLMVFVPGSILLAFIFSQTRQIKLFAAIAIVIVLLTVIPTYLTIPTITSPAIPESSYDELQSLKKYIDNPKETLIVTRHGLEWWCAWALRTAVIQDHDLKVESWDKFDKVLMLTQNQETNGNGMQQPPPGGFERPDKMPPLVLKNPPDDFNGGNRPPPGGPGDMNSSMQPPQGGGGFPEVQLTKDAKVLYKGEYYTLYLAENPPSNLVLMKK